MAKKRSSKQRQQARQRKAERRKKRARSRRSHPFLFTLGRRGQLQKAGQWPLYECWLTKEWNQEAMLVQILIARRSPIGEIALGAFLVDLGCLGVKNAYGVVTSMVKYRQVRDRMRANQEMIKTDDLNLVAKIVREGIAYAKELGFKPHPDYRDAMLVLGDADPDACDVPVPLGGKDGRPFFIAGPYDNVKRIMNTLTRKLGPDGFTYLVPVDPGTEVFLAAEIDEEEDF